MAMAASTARRSERRSRGLLVGSVLVTRLWRVGVALVVTILVASACTSGGDGNRDGGSASRKSITLVTNVEPRTLASWEAFATSAYPVLRNVQEALMNRDPQTNELVGELATSWEQVDPLTWQFHLREGVTFHDGSPFNAEAAAFGLNYTWAKENAFDIRQFLGPELEAEAVDEYTLDVTTEEPDPLLPTRLYMSPIPSMVQLQEDPDAYSREPIGTGPYRFVEWARGDFVRLEANPDWWGNDSADAYGEVAIDEAIFRFQTEPSVRFAMLESGEVQFARWITSDQCDQAPKCIGGPGVETVWVRFDTNNPLLADPRIRQAINLAIDRDAIINTIMGGGTVATGLVGPSALGFDPDLTAYPYDPNAAADLVTEAASDGVPVDTQLRILADSGHVNRANESIQLIADQLRSVGFENVSTELLETIRFEEMYALNTQQVPEDRAVLAFSMHGNEIMDFSSSLDYFGCVGWGSGVCDQRIEDLVATALPIPATGEERGEALQQIFDYVYENYYIAAIGQPDFYFGLDENLQWTDRLDGLILLKEMSYT